MVEYHIGFDRWWLVPRPIRVRDASSDAREEFAEGSFIRRFDRIEPVFPGGRPEW